MVGNISDEIARLRVNGRPTLQKTDANLEFAKYLKANQYISYKDYKKDSTKIELFPKGKILNNSLKD